MSRSLVLLAVLPCLAACAMVPRLTESDKEDLARAMASPATFEVGKEESTAAWGRAQIFLFKHSRIKTVSDFVIDAGRVPHYTAERLPLGEDRYRITLVREAPGQAQGPESPAQKEQREQDLHVFAHFVRTGELACARDGVSVCVSPQESELSLQPFQPAPFHPPVIVTPPTVIVH
jgi:hypothetical protein